MQIQTSSLILTFGVADPIGAIGIQADLATFAAMGCHGLSVITAILISDTVRIEDTQAIDVEWVDDQARVMLEDMPVAAFKVGYVGSIENVSAIAEIVSDYPDIPLILDPFITTIPEGVDNEQILIAIRELLIPQTTLLLISVNELAHLAETWREPIHQPEQDMLLLDVMHLIGLGTEFVLVTGTPCELNQVANTLYDASGAIQHDAAPRIAGAFAGAGSTLSAAIAALLANGLEMAEAITEAQEFTIASLSNAQHFGMGKPVLDRYFWARETDATPPPSIETPKE